MIPLFTYCRLYIWPPPEYISENAKAAPALRQSELFNLELFCICSFVISDQSRSLERDHERSE